MNDSQIVAVIVAVAVVQSVCLVASGWIGHVDKKLDALHITSKLRLDYVGLLNTLNIKNEHHPGSFNTVVPQIRNTYQRIRDATYVELSNVV